ncbi:MAG: type II toxin-antitoxin system HicA family toxin [bacterium]
MPPRLPPTSGDSLVKLLQSLGYSVVRQRGSHVRLQRVSEAGVHRITVPAHKTLAKGTLNDILSRVSIWTGVSKTKLLDRL